MHELKKMKRNLFVKSVQANFTTKIFCVNTKKFTPSRYFAIHVEKGFPVKTSCHYIQRIKNVKNKLTVERLIVKKMEFLKRYLFVFSACNAFLDSW
jgi:hypothetical protein